MSSIVALHGFLGRPSDWDFLPYDNVMAVDLFKENSLHDFSNQTIEGGILLGYSLGARLALHALIDSPQKWRAGIIVSGHPGLETDLQRQERLLADEVWAKRFETESWKELMDSWNSQPVLATSTTSPVRNESDFSRKQLAKALRKWSLGRQENLREQVEALDIPILWIAGENDSKFAAIARSMSLKHPKSTVWIAKETGHRVPWEKSIEFIEQLDTFLNKIKETSLC